MRLNSGQEYIANEAEKFIENSYEQVMQIDGDAGTGKTVLLNAIVERSRIPRHRIAAMAYIGQAAIIMRMNGFQNAKTIHSWIYNPVKEILKDKQGNPVYDNYYNRPIYTTGFENKPLDNIDLIIIDEAGTVPESMKYDIEKHGIKIIASGDLAQLPPVFGKSAYLTNGKIYHLTEHMRQKKNSNILNLARLAKNGNDIPYGFFGDCLVIDEDSITEQMILNSDVVICGKNKTRDKYNTKIRRMLHHVTDIPEYGERIICRKNNWNVECDHISLANGLLGTVTNNPGIDGFDGDTFGLDFKPYLLNSSFKGLRVDYKYMTASHEEREKLKRNRYNKGEKFEYGYAITTHSSQGGAFNSVLYIAENIYNGDNKSLQKNLDYTGITRARERLIFVKPKIKKYYFMNRYNEI